MVMMTPATHQFVDRKLREAAEVIEQAQGETVATKGYKNFELALEVIYECRTMIDQETENDAVIGHLKTAAVALAAFNSGVATPSVQSAIGSIGGIVDELPDCPECVAGDSCRANTPSASEANRPNGEAGRYRPWTRAIRLRVLTTPPAADS